MTLIITSLQGFFKQFPDTSKYVVAFSGGLDSTVLLHVMHKLNLSLHAVHVNHHIERECDQWEQHCKRICESWDIQFSVRHVQINKIPQKSIEESARDARYKLLFEFLSARNYLITAHHKNDLAETLLLQLLRGSGPAGLAAMSTEQNLSLGKHLRPLLEYTRTELLDYAQHHSLNWVEDLSNESLDFDRNYLRKEIMPRLIDRWPGALQTLSRVADLQADAMGCLRELADLDLQTARTENSCELNLKAIQQLSRVRINNALRSWIQDHGMRVPNKKLLEHIVADIVNKEYLESSPVQTWVKGEVRRYRDHIYLMEPLSAHDPTQEYQWKIDLPLHIESLNRTLFPTDIERHGLKLPEGASELIVRFRSGGERLKPIGKKHHRSLKNLFQEAHVPPWERDRIPLLYYHDQLISVLGYWNAAINCETS